jgi:hypothetical protein
MGRANIPQRSVRLRALLVADYLAGTPSREVDKKHGVWPGATLRALKRLGIPSRGYGQNRRRSIQTDYFTVIDTEEKAYWLGFLAADGCVTARQVKLTLQRRDRAHVEKFRAAVGSDAPVIDYEARSPYSGNVHTYSRCAISSTRMAADLTKLGVTPRKSHTLRPWLGPPTLARHYIRGIVDGDGTLSASGQPVAVGVVGNAYVCAFVARHIEELTGVPTKVYRHHTICQVRTTRRNQAIDVVRYLYGEATVSLDRKMELAEAIMAMPRLG